MRSTKEMNFCKVARLRLQGLRLDCTDRMHPWYKEMLCAIYIGSNRQLYINNNYYKLTFANYKSLKSLIITIIIIIIVPSAPAHMIIISTHN